jgi:hypothetical protein
MALGLDLSRTSPSNHRASRRVELFANKRIVSSSKRDLFPVAAGDLLLLL